MKDVRIKLFGFALAFVVWVGLLFASCTPQQAQMAHTATDVAEPVCTGMVAAKFPGFEGLCSLADDALDAVIDGLVKKPTSEPRLSMAAKSEIPPKDQARINLLSAARHVKALRASQRLLDGGAP